MTKVSELKNENINAIRHCFYDQSIHTKNQLSQMTGISLSAVTNVLQHLLKTQEIKRVDDARSTGGRKSKQYILNQDHAYIGMIIFKKTKDDYRCQLKIVDLFSKVLLEKEIVKKKDGLIDFEKCIKTILKNKNVKVLVISIPGVSEGGVIKECDFRHFENIDLGKAIRKYTDIPVVLENDMNIAVIGLSLQYPTIKNMAFLYQPAKEEFGCGILIFGKLYNGFRHAAGELKYLPDHVKDPKRSLKNRIEVLQAVLDPELIGWYSDLVDEIDRKERVEHLTDLYGYIEKGLFKIGFEQIKNGGK